MRIVNVERVSGVFVEYDLNDCCASTALRARNRMLIRTATPFAFETTILDGGYVEEMFAIGNEGCRATPVLGCRARPIASLPRTFTACCAAAGQMLNDGARRSSQSDPVPAVRWHHSVACVASATVDAAWIAGACAT